MKLTTYFNTPYIILRSFGVFSAFSNRIVRFVFYSKIGLTQLDGRRERPLSNSRLDTNIDDQNPSVTITTVSGGGAVNLRLVFNLLHCATVWKGNNHN